MLSTILQNGRNCDLGLSTGLKFRVTRVSHHHCWGGRVGCDSKSVCKRMKPPGLEDKGERRGGGEEHLDSISKVCGCSWGIHTGKGFWAEGDAQEQWGVSEEEGDPKTRALKDPQTTALKDPKTRALTVKLCRVQGVWWRHSCGGEQRCLQAQGMCHHAHATERKNM